MIRCFDFDAVFTLPRQNKHHCWVKGSDDNTHKTTIALLGPDTVVWYTYGGERITEEDVVKHLETELTAIQTRAKLIEQILQNK